MYVQFQPDDLRISGVKTKKNTWKIRKKMFFLVFLRFFLFFCSFFYVFHWNFRREGFPKIPSKYPLNPPKSFPYEFSLFWPLKLSSGRISTCWIRISVPKPWFRGETSDTPHSMNSQFSEFFKKLFALRESRRGTLRQALGGVEAQRHGGSEALIHWSWKLLGSSWWLPENFEQICFTSKWPLFCTTGKMYSGRGETS